MALVNMCPYNFGKYAGVGQGSFVHINHDVWRTDLRWNPSEVFFERPFIESVMVHGGRFKLYSIQWEAIEPLTSSRGEGYAGPPLWHKALLWQHNTDHGSDNEKITVCCVYAIPTYELKLFLNSTIYRPKDIWEEGGKYAPDYIGMHPLPKTSNTHGDPDPIFKLLVAHSVICSAEQFLDTETTGED